MALYTDIAFKRDTVLDQGELNRRMKALADAIEGLRGFEADWTTQIDEIRQYGLDRINGALLPIVRTIAEQASVGLLFTAPARSGGHVGTGRQMFIIHEDKRTVFIPTADLAILPDDNPSIRMYARTVSYDPEFGLLDVDVTYVQGAGEWSYTDWTIMAAPSFDAIVDATGKGFPPFPSRAAAEAAWVSQAVDTITVRSGGLLIDYVRDPYGTALKTNGGGVKWSPAWRREKLGTFPTLQALAADTSMLLGDGVAVGDYVDLQKEGYAYRVVDAEPDITTAGGVKLKRDMIAYRAEAEPSTIGEYANSWRGGRDIHLIYGEEEAHLEKPMIWLQRKVSVPASGGGQGTMGLKFSGEIKESVSSPGGNYSGIRSFMRNRGVNNDCTALNGQIANYSTNGMSCAVFGGAFVSSANVNATMAVEGHIYLNVGTTGPRDHSGEAWKTAFHAYSDSTAAAAHYALLIGSNGAKENRYGFWNGIGINGNAFMHKGVPGTPGTVGINMAWSATEYPELGIKFGNVGKYHISREAHPIKMLASEFSVTSETTNAGIFVIPTLSTFGIVSIRPLDGQNRASMVWEGGANEHARIVAGNNIPLRFVTGGGTRMEITGAGRVRLLSLPTSAAGLQSGTLWNDGGTLKVAP